MLSNGCSEILNTEELINNFNIGTNWLATEINSEMSQHS